VVLFWWKCSLNSLYGLDTTTYFCSGFCVSILVGLRFQFQALGYMFKVNIAMFSSTLLKMYMCGIHLCINMSFFNFMGIP